MKVEDNFGKSEECESLIRDDGEWFACHQVEHIEEPDIGEITTDPSKELIVETDAHQYDCTHIKREGDELYCGDIYDDFEKIIGEIEQIREQPVVE